MRESSRNFMVGVTSIGGLIGLAALMMSFGELDRFTNPRYRVTLLTQNAAGLRGGGTVEFNGVPVGVIDKVETTSDAANPVSVGILVTSGVQLPTDVDVSVTSPLIGGSSLLRFNSPARQPGDVVAYLPDDGTATIHGEFAGGVMDSLASALDERMKPLMASLEKFNALADTYTKVGENMNDLLRQQQPEALTGGEPPNLRTAVIKINTAIDEATEGLRLAKEWLGDEQLRADVRGAVEKANRLIEQATAAVDRYTLLATSIETNVNDLTNRLTPVADQMAATLESVRSLAQRASNGEGTLGQMLNNPDLYNSLTDAAIRLERTLVEVQLFIQKVKAEGLPMRLF